MIAGNTVPLRFLKESLVKLTASGVAPERNNLEADWKSLVKAEPSICSAVPETVSDAIVVTIATFISGKAYT